MSRAPCQQPLTLDPAIAAWARQPHEPAHAFAWFQVYATMGPGRTLASTAGIIGKSERYLRNLSAPQLVADASASLGRGAGPPARGTACP
jgi:hypothetical protein